MSSVSKLQNRIMVLKGGVLPAYTLTRVSSLSLKHSVQGSSLGLSMWICQNNFIFEFFSIQRTESNLWLVALGFIRKKNFIKS